MLSTDQNIFKAGSGVQERMIEYGNLVEELRIVVFTRRKLQIPKTKLQTNPKIQISKNVWIYPTNTQFKPFYFFDAYKIAKSIIAKPHTLTPIPWVVSAQDPFETGFMGYLLQRKFKLPLQIQIHTDFLSPYFWQESLKNKIRVLLGKWLVKRADCLRVVSERIKKSLMAIGYAPNPISVLPIFVDVEKIKNTLIKTDLHKKYPGYDFIILMASRLTKEKNIGMAIEAVAEIKRQATSDKRQVLLLIVGDGPETESYKLLVKSYKLENIVIFEPVVDSQTLFSYYKTADLFLNTSNYEGYGRTLVEAVAAGATIISSDVGIAGEILEPENIFKVGDKKDLAEKLKAALNGKIRPAKNLPSQTKEAYLKLYKEYLERVLDLSHS